MTESESASMDELPEKVWDFIKDNPKIIGMPITENKGIDLLNALRDIYKMIEIDQQVAQNMMTVLANILVAAAQGDGDKLVEEVLVQDAMADFDQQIGVILDEGR